MKWMHFVIVFLILSFAMWFIVEGLLWLHFKFTPVTEWGRTVSTWFAHIGGFALAAGWTFILLDPPRSKRRR